MGHTELRHLFVKYMKGKLTPAEYEQFSEAAQTHTTNDWQEAIAPLIENTSTTEVFDEREWKDVIEYLIRQPAIKRAKAISMNRWWRRIAVAASIMLMLGGGSYFLFFNKPAKQDKIVKVPVMPNDVKAPATNKAMITLANGQKVYLDSVSNGQLAMQGNVKLVKLANGQIAYELVSGEVLTEIEYNTLENPRGSKVVSMTLADGSKVWLNSGSSLTYPVAFVGNERRVSITGEAYFEVAHNSSMPFYVTKGETVIQVLGTHFNANAYADEAAIRVTLLEGSVKIIKGSKTDFLKPGEQARISSDIKIVDDVDMEEVMAWKNGKFQFGEAADIVTIMKQISRWYDLDVEYKGVIKEHIGGTISRDVNVSQVFKMLEMTGVVTFQIDGKKVTVMPK